MKRYIVTFRDKTNGDVFEVGVVARCNNCAYKKARKMKRFSSAQILKIVVSERGIKSE